MLNVEGVSKYYGQRQAALSNISFRIDKGEMVFLTGASGAGKSTLLRLLYLEEKPSAGRILLDRFDLSRISKRKIPFLRRHVGVIFQDFRLIPERTAAENVALTLEVLGKSGREIRRKTDEALNLVGLLGKRNNYPYQLSGGEAQRVSVARAVVNEPLVLLADEPTGNLDEQNSRELLELLSEINMRGATTIIATHQVQLTAKYAKRTLNLVSGILEKETR
ncbi:MAG TPA: cell division ATP-binding protein FtsE [candidate division Zixibacteria bacterium]|nr:cell division ATP-binding protein FtsE [candidate division Zixibacteria bacterium]HBZ00902.1 cell division ATP-binding protein FtsE [candidate division Zixibacteria bacterium]